MGLKNKNQGHGFALKILSLQILPWLMLGIQVLVFFLSMEVSIFPEAGDWKSIIGTCAEIIAGLYGITTAGYTFFLSRIDALTATDSTLDYVVASIKNRFKYLIWYITVNVLMTLLISIILMYSPIPTGEQVHFFYRLFCNEFLVFLIFSIILILCYSIWVIDPNCISKEAAKLKRRLAGRSMVPGSAVAFITLYDRIQELCDGMLPQPVLRQLRENKGNHFELTLELLQEQHLLPAGLILDLTRIHRYYACAVNTTPLGVSQEMCLLAKKTVEALERHPFTGSVN